VSTSTARARAADGNVSVLVTAFIVIAMLLSFAVARLGGAVVEKSRANTAADAAALAAADRLARGDSAAEACRAARAAAVDNAGRLLSCRCVAASVEVIVERGAARSRARAAVTDTAAGESGIRRDAGASSRMARASANLVQRRRTLSQHRSQW
jgi:secretion/DNA translocation related TadE-like protein